MIPKQSSKGIPKTEKNKKIEKNGKPTAHKWIHFNEPENIF